MDPYTDLFHDYVVASTTYLVGKVQTTPSLLAAGDRRQALHTLSYALRLPPAWPAARTLLLDMAPKMERAGYRMEWLPYLQQGVQQCRQQEDTVTEAELALQIGYTLFLQGNYAEAHTWFAQSFHCFQQVHHPIGQGTALNRMAMVAQRQRDFPAAKRLVAQALPLLGNASERANSYTVLGEIALEAREWTHAEHYFRQALQIWEEDHDQRRTAWGLRNLGVSLLEQADHAGAVACYQQAIALLEQEGDRVNLATIQMNLGVIYSRTGRMQEALPLFATAAQIFRVNQDRPYLASVYTNQAIAYRRLEQWQLAEQSCRAAIELWEKLGDEMNLVNVKDELGLIRLGQHCVEGAIVIFTEALEQVQRMKKPAPRLLALVSDHLHDAKKRALSYD
ncbi:MAG: tetratricopeptide repeat protein [Caldilineaceae bacterium]